MMHVSREEALNHFEAGYPDSMGGQMNQAFAPVLWSYPQKDKTMVDQYYEFANRQLRGANPTDAHATFFDDGGAPALSNNTVIKVTEPLISPPFDCYSKVDKASMPDWSPWKWMSKVIPNVDRLTIDIQLTKLDASMMFYYYGRGSANTRPPALNILPGGVAANLILYWAEVPSSTTIPRSLDLQTWNVREFQDVTNNGAVSVNLTSRDDRSSLIQLNSVPSLILTHLERDKDNTDYQPVAYTSQRNAIGAAPQNVRVGGAIHSWDNYGEINTITYLLGDRPNVISATFSQRELYDLTQKNSKNFPYRFDDWRGRKRPVTNAGAFQSGTDARQSVEVNIAAWQDYPCKCMVAVTGADIANKTSTGVFSSNSLQIVVNWRPHSGYAGGTAGNNVYQLYNHLLFGAEFLRIEPDKSQFQSQSLDEGTARRLTDPPLGSMSIPSSALAGSLRVGGSLGVGGALAPLRDRGVSSISSRLP